MSEHTAFPPPDAPRPAVPPVPSVPPVPPVPPGPPVPAAPGWAAPPGPAGPVGPAGPSLNKGWGAPPPGWEQQGGQGAPARTPGWGGPPPGHGLPPLAAKPGVVPLRPLTLGEIYDGAFQAMRRNPAAMMGSAALVATVIVAVSSVAQFLLADSLTQFASMDPTYTPTNDELATGAGALGLFALVSLVLQLLGISLLTGILVTALSQAVLGQRPTFGEVWRAAAPRMLPLVGLTMLFVVGYCVLSIAVFVPGIMLTVVSGVAGAIVIILSIFVWLAGLAWLFVRLTLAAPALVLERIGVFASMRRGWTLTRDSYWRCLGILVLAGLIVTVANGVLVIPGALVSGVYGVANPDDPLAVAGFHPVQLVINGVTGIIASTIVYPFWAAVTSLLYIDLRMRREGLDIELARAARH